MNSQPVSTGIVPVNQIARDAAEARARRNASASVKQRSLELTLGPAGERKAKSFFPCLEPVVRYIRFKLGLSFKPASPLNKIEQTNLAVYKRFKNFERSIRKGVFAQNPQHFCDINDSLAKVKKFHRKFNRELDNRLAQFFFSELRTARRQYPVTDFHEAIFAAYTSIYTSLVRRLVMDRHSYPKGYIDTAHGQLDKIVATLRAAITPHEEPPESALALQPASEPIAPDAPAPVAEKRPTVYLSAKECIDLASEQFAFCQEAIARSVEEFIPSAGIGKWPENAVYAFNQIGSNAIDELLRNLSSGQVSTKDLRAAYIHGMQLAEAAAVGDGISFEEFGAGDVREFRGILSDIRANIHSELGKRDPRIAELFRP